MGEYAVRSDLNTLLSVPTLTLTVTDAVIRTRDGVTAENENAETAREGHKTRRELSLSSIAPKRAARLILAKFAVHLENERTKRFARD
jgi:hypothetical protein